jgi:hypothetical protein
VGLNVRFSNSQVCVRLPSSSERRALSNPPAKPSSTVSGPVKPARARSAATTPAWAAQPACSRFVQVPFDQQTEACAEDLMGLLRGKAATVP